MIGPNTTVNIIGGGKVGQTLGHLLTKLNLAEVNQVYCRDLQHSVEACRFIGGGKPINNLSKLTFAHINIITTRDNAIKSTCENIVSKAAFKFDKAIFVHCSGAQSAQDALMSVKNKGALIASCHPAISFSSPIHTIHSYTGAFCGIEGDAEACMTLSNLFSELCFKPFNLQSEKKELYHAACVTSNNFIYALGHMATQMFICSGVEGKLSMELTTSIMRNAMENLGVLPFNDVLSGPIARADIDTLSKHKESVKVLNCQNVENIFQSLGTYCLTYLTKHPPEVKNLIRSVIE